MVEETVWVEKYVRPRLNSDELWLIYRLIDGEYWLLRSCYRDYIAVDESAYGCPFVSARGIKNLLGKSGIGLWLADMKNRLRQRED